MKERITGYVWVNVPLDYQGRENLIEAIKKRIDMYGDFMFSDDYLRFRRVKTYDEVCGKLSKTDISVKFDYYLADEEPEFEIRTDLPPPVFTPKNKQVKRRQ